MNEGETQQPEGDDHFSPPAPSAPGDTSYRHARWPRLLHSSDIIRSRPSPRVDNPAVRDPRRIVVVGVCSSGKSSLVRVLREQGYMARACAQEHSYVPQLWKRTSPDVLVYLDASLHTIRRRRKARWPQSMLDEEHRRLLDARQNCQLYVHTDGLAPEDVASRVLTFLNNHQAQP